jgi:hypothetical protein
MYLTGKEFNREHHDFQYKVGRNVDTNQFAPYPMCTPNGLYFTDSNHILKYLEHHIREVSILDDAFVFGKNGKYKADIIILLEHIMSEDELLKLISRDLWTKKDHFETCCIQRYNEIHLARYDYFDSYLVHACYYNNNELVNMICKQFDIDFSTCSYSNHICKFYERDIKINL